MSDIDWEGIECRVDAATYIGWQTGKSWAGEGAVMDAEGHPIAVCGEGDQAAKDAAFIAHARQDIPVLLDEIDRLRGRLAAHRNTIAGVRHLVERFETPGDMGRTRVFVSDLRNVLDGRS
jgi:hypothetical protein